MIKIYHTMSRPRPITKIDISDDEISTLTKNISLPLNLKTPRGQAEPTTMKEKLEKLPRSSSTPDSLKSKLGESKSADSVNKKTVLEYKNRRRGKLFDSAEYYMNKETGQLENIRISQL